MALALGCTVGELGQRMTAREFGEWRTYAATSPLPGRASDVRHALLCALLANINRSSTQPAFRAADFLPFVPPREVSADDVVRELWGDENAR